MNVRNQPLRAAAAGAFVLALSSMSASAAIVCNGDACWHAHAKYDYPLSAHVTVHPDTWKWGPRERYVWKEHDGRGYWNGDRWTEF
jgi:hypothetical protein